MKIERKQLISLFRDIQVNEAIPFLTIDRKRIVSVIEQTRKKKPNKVFLVRRLNEIFSAAYRMRDIDLNNETDKEFLNLCNGINSSNGTKKSIIDIVFKTDYKAYTPANLKFLNKHNLEGIKYMKYLDSLQEDLYLDLLNKCDGFPTKLMKIAKVSNQVTHFYKTITDVADTLQIKKDRRIPKAIFLDEFRQSKNREDLSERLNKYKDIYAIPTLDTLSNIYGTKISYVISLEKLMDAIRNSYSLREAAEKLDISVVGLYKILKRNNTERTKAKKELLKKLPTPKPVPSKIFMLGISKETFTEAIELSHSKEDVCKVLNISIHQLDKLIYYYRITGSYTSIKNFKDLNLDEFYRKAFKDGKRTDTYTLLNFYRIEWDLIEKLIDNYPNYLKVKNYETVVH